MNLETRLQEAIAHLSCVINYGVVTDEIDRNHVLDARTELKCALAEIRAEKRASNEMTQRERANA